MKTKEDILEAVALDIFSLEQILDELFTTNIVISKGDTLQSQFNGEWGDILTVNDTVNYRIKPTIVEYETMWYDDEGNIKWMTDHEADIQTRYLYEAKETKRIRG